MTMARQSLGVRGEDVACEELERRGYTVIMRRYRTVHGEIDIVAQHGEFLVFVEVKARTGDDFGDPEEAVTSQKQQRLVWMATDYLARHCPNDVACRFDVVGVNTTTSPPRVTVIDDAFRPGW
jgi:putative endonuclease